MINSPGVYDLTAQEYFDDPCPLASLSAHIAAVLIAKTPMHAAFLHKRLNPAFEDDDDSKKFDFGNAMHAALLGGARIALIQAENYRTKAAQDQRDTALARHSVPCLPEQYERVQAACKAVWRHLTEHREASTALASGTPEQTLVWREGVIWCRAKLDWLPEEVIDREKLGYARGIERAEKHGRVDFYDLKTTTDANPEVFSRRIFDLGHDIQCAFYRRGIRAVLGIEDPVFRFVAVETKAPHGVSVNQLSPSALDLAERKVEEAIAIWTKCIRKSQWPGYPPYVHHVDAPAYHAMRYEDRQLRREQIGDLTPLDAG